MVFRRCTFSQKCGNFRRDIFLQVSRNNLIFFHAQRSRFCGFSSLLSSNKHWLSWRKFHPATVAQRFQELFVKSLHTEKESFDNSWFSKYFARHFLLLSLSAEKSDNFWVCSFVYILNDRSALSTNP